MTPCQNGDASTGVELESTSTCFSSPWKQNAGPCHVNGHLGTEVRKTDDGTEAGGCAEKWVPGANRGLHPAQLPERDRTQGQ
jgi:hypothetical protein